MREHDIVDEITSYAEQFFKEPTFGILGKMARHTRTPELLALLWEKAKTDWWRIEVSYTRDLMAGMVNNVIAKDWLIEEAAEYGVVTVLLRMDKVVNAPAVVTALYKACKDQKRVDQIFYLDPGEIRPQDLYCLAKHLVTDGDKANLTRLMGHPVDDKTTGLLLAGGVLPVATAKVMLEKPGCPRALLNAALGIERDVPDPEIWNLVGRDYTSEEDRLKFFNLPAIRSRPDFDELFESHFRGESAVLLRGSSHYRTSDAYRAFPKTKELILEMVEANKAMGVQDYSPQNILAPWLVGRPQDFTPEFFARAFTAFHWENMNPATQRGLINHKYATPEMVKRIKPAWVFRCIEEASQAGSVIEAGNVTQFQLAIWIALLEAKRPRGDLEARHLRERKWMLTGVVARVSEGGQNAAYAGPELLQVLWKALSRTKEVDAKVRLASDSRLPLRLVKQAAKVREPSVASAAQANLQRRSAHANPVPSQPAPIPGRTAASPAATLP